MTTKVVINPKTGKMETVNDYSEEAAQRKLHETRKELRDMLNGNTQFHTDNLGPDKPKPEDNKVVKPDSDAGFGYYGQIYD